MLRPPNDGIWVVKNVLLGVAVLGGLWVALGVFLGIAIRTALWIINL